jgi:hypothetical protein
MVERVYGHFRNQSFHDAQARLDAAHTIAADGRRNDGSGL